MKHNYALSIWSLLTAVLLMTIALSLLTNVYVFALFWLSILGLLIAILNKKIWKSSEWLAFAAFVASTITGVLFSAHITLDRVGLGITVLGLLLVTAVVNAIHETPAKKKKTFVAVSSANGKKYHRPGCTLLTHDQQLIYFSSTEQAQLSGRTACTRCYSE